MQNELKVGQTFRVFEVISDIYNMDYIGKWAAECDDGFTGGDFGVNLSLSEFRPHFGFDGREEIKQVGLLRITKLKCPF